MNYRLLTGWLLAAAAALPLPAFAAGTGLTLPERPVFAATSTAPVLLRYKFAAGETQKLAVRCAMGMKLAVNGRIMDIPISFDIDATLKVDTVAASGDASGTLLIGRAAVRVTGLVNLDFDSATAGTNVDAKYRPLLAMVGVPIGVTVSAQGKLSDVDTAAFTRAIGAAGAAAGFKPREFLDQLCKSTFVQLAAGPVKVGDVYDAGEIVQELTGVGKLRVAARYRVLAVSADGSQALLEPVATGRIDSAAAASVKVDMKKFEMAGWLLFDVARGVIARSAGDLRVDLAVAVGAQAMGLEIVTRVVYETLP